MLSEFNEMLRNEKKIIGLRNNLHPYRYAAETDETASGNFQKKPPYIGERGGLAP